MFCCLMAVGNALLFAFNRHYLTLITCGVMLASIANAAMRSSSRWRGSTLTARRGKW